MNALESQILAAARVATKARRCMRLAGPAPRRAARLPMCGLVLLWAGGVAGCQSPGAPRTPREAKIAAAARPILRLDPDAVWLTGYNQLLELGPDSLHYLARQPALAEPATHDSLATLVHASLFKLLLSPGVGPWPSATCLETSLDLLHFEVKVDGERVGALAQTMPNPPARWRELYPAEFNHLRAASIDVESDRAALVTWYQAHRDDLTPLLARHRLRPRADELWRILGRRHADQWEYLAGPEPTTLVSWHPQDQAMLRLTTYDYNIVRAACIWLGTTNDDSARLRLIRLVGHPSRTVSHNALFALRFSPEPRIRELLGRYKPGVENDRIAPPESAPGPIGM